MSDDSKAISLLEYTLEQLRAEAERARAYASRPGWLRAVIQAVCRIW